MANEEETYEDELFEDERSPLQSKMLPIAVLAVLAGSMSDSRRPTPVRVESRGRRRRP